MKYFSFYLFKIKQKKYFCQNKNGTEINLETKYCAVIRFFVVVL